MTTNQENLLKRVIVALDYSNLREARDLVEQLQGRIHYYKVGLELFTACGDAAIEMIQSAGAKVFLDLKLHDIPNTVARTVQLLCRKKVDMLNVHALGGREMMCAAREAADEALGGSGHQMQLIAVTILTSHHQETLTRELNISKKVDEQVLHLAQLAKQSGLSGVVCSAHEVVQLKKEISEPFIAVTPGIRPESSQAGDQKRVMTPQEAFQNGADYIVIGRPITQAQNPLQVVESLFDTI